MKYVLKSPDAVVKRGPRAVLCSKEMSLRSIKTWDVHLVVPNATVSLFNGLARSCLRSRIEELVIW